MLSNVRSKIRRMKIKPEITTQKVCGRGPSKGQSLWKMLGSQNKKVEHFSAGGMRLSWVLSRGKALGVGPSPGQAS